MLGVDEEIVPVRRGDWIARITDPSRVATVRAAYIQSGTVLVDLYLHATDGHRIGRESPPCGGPRTFEPACEYTGYWQRITRPEFPIRLRWVPDGNGRSIAGYHHNSNVLPDRKIVRRLPKLPPLSAAGNLDIELEVRAKIMAAQELRDLARQSGLHQLIERAERLEREAADLRKPM